MRFSHRDSRRIAPLLFLGALQVFSVSAFPQGTLAPPGAPAPTMKTLDQVEARTPIDAAHTPGDSTNLFIISNSGSYYLTGNVTGASGKNGIVINADNVTVNLNGFTLSGGNGSLKGVVVAGARQNITISTGIVSGWGGTGADASTASNSQLFGLLLSGNGGDGLVAGSASVVRNIVASNNGGSGIHVIGANCRVEDNNSASNGGSGIRIDAPGNLIIKNNATSNATADYTIAAGSSYGQVVVAPGAGFTNATAWANFSSSCMAGQVFCAGACTNLSTDTANCGSCGNACTVANGTAGCNAGNCIIAACNVGFSNCNNQYADGCEVNTGADVSNCGGCGIVCANVANATRACTAGACVIAACNAGFANCNNIYNDGCEVNTNTNVSNCGSCGNVCNVANGTAGCAAGACTVVACNAGFGNCNNNPADGCEVSLNTNVANCGGCGIVCSSNHITPTCTAGQCNGTCSAGFADCDGNKQTNGCEVNTQTDPNNCGTCGHVCAGVHICSAGVCQ